MKQLFQALDNTQHRDVMLKRREAYSEFHINSGFLPGVKF